MTTTAAILTIGDELMVGDRIDTNGPWLSQTLQQYGISTDERCSVCDDAMRIASEIRQLARSHDLLILTGGLGPTEDDRTREALAVAMQEDLIFDVEAHQTIEAWFSARGATMSEANDTQAMRPNSAIWIRNANGTAPGLRAKIGSCRVLALPGPPGELKPMFRSIIEEVIDGLRCGIPKSTVELHAWGLSEADAGKMISDLMQDQIPMVAMLIGEKGVTARVTGDEATLLEAVVQEIEERWSPWVYGRNGETLASRVGQLLIEEKGSLATAESCTGGCLGSMLVDAVGASAWYRGGWVTYSNSMKVKELDVPKTLLDEHGAVSCEVAAAMCIAAASKSGASVSLSTTGVAGPEGGIVDKPVGSVFIASMVRSNVEVRLFRFSGDRNEIRRRTASTAMQILRLRLLGIECKSMCWQHGEIVPC